MNDGTKAIKVRGDISNREKNDFADWMSLVDPGAENVFDFADAGSIDSAGIALMVQLKRLARANNARIRFTNLPERALYLIRMYGIAELLEIELPKLGKAADGA